MLPLLAACTPEPTPKIPGEPTDTATSAEDSPTDPHEPPWATILSPEPDATLTPCDGVSITGQVGDPDGAVEDLVVSWSAAGVVLGFGAPEPDGSTLLDWSPPDGQWDLTLSVVDPDDLSGQDTLSFQFSADLSLSYRWARSAMDARVGADSLGACTAAALALPTEAAEVWDDGVYTPPEYAADGLAAGRHWASWDQVNPVDCHLFQLTVEVPACPTASSLRLVSPWFDGAPINDDVYVYVDGVAVLSAGTSLGAAQNGPMETGSWMAEPLDIPLTLLSPGTHVLDLVVQEYAGWGGLGYLEPTLR